MICPWSGCLGLGHVFCTYWSLIGRLDLSSVYFCLFFVVFFESFSRESFPSSFCPFTKFVSLLLRPRHFLVQYKYCRYDQEFSLLCGGGQGEKPTSYMYNESWI